MLMRCGEEWVRRYDTSSLRLVISAGEILGHETWRWLRDNVCRWHGCEVIETWGQTENAGFIAAPGGLGLGGIKVQTRLGGASVSRSQDIRGGR